MSGVLQQQAAPAPNPRKPPPAWEGRDPLPPDRRSRSKPRQAFALTPSYGTDVAEYLELPDGDSDSELTITPTEDGGAYVEYPGEREEATPPDQGFYTNLAEILPAAVKHQIVTELLQRIEEDKEARAERDKQYEEGIKRTGLGKDAPGGAQFEGASRVVHPMMTEACTDYESRIIKEIWPVGGPAKPHMIGAPTREKEIRAARKADHMNWQFTVQIKEARATLETTLTQVPLGGSQFIRLWQDHRLKRPRMQFVSVDNVHIPAKASDFASAHRKTFVDTISAVEFRQRVDQGMYVEIPNLAPPAQYPEPTKSESATSKVQGVDGVPPTNRDGDRQIYESSVHLEVTEDAVDAINAMLGDGQPEQPGQIFPYLISIDESTKEMLAMYRDWEDRDPAREPIEHLFEFPFIPWRGSFAIGLPHIIGGLSAAATGALRALLDTAHIANASGGYILKGSGVSGQTRAPPPGTLLEIDGGMEADDIRKRVLPNGMVQPSPVLFQLMGFVVEAARNVVRTTLDEAASGVNGQQGGPATPVGTQMSRVEETMVVFSAVHGRAHAAFNRLIAGLHRLNRLYMPEVLRVDAEGKEILIRRSDYDGPCDVVPISDPNIYSDLQRFQQLNFLQARAMAAPDLYNLRAVELAGLKLMKWPNPEAMLNAPAAPEETNAVTENVNLALGKGALVVPEQDHLAHLQVHLDFMSSPILGQNPIIAPTFVPAALKHIGEHILNYYAANTIRTIESAGGVSAQQMMTDDVQVKGMFDRLLAMASQHVVPGIAQAMQLAMPVIMQGVQYAKSQQPPPPVDPGRAALQASLAETQRKGAADKADAASDQSDAAIKQQQNAIQEQRVQTMQGTAQLNAATKIQTAEMAHADAAERLGVASETGQGNPTAIEAAG